MGLRAFAVLLLCLHVPVSATALPSSVLIENTAIGTHAVGDLSGIETPSNTVRIRTLSRRTPSTLELQQYAPSAAWAEPTPVAITEYSASGTDSGPFRSMPPPTPVGEDDPIDLSHPVRLVATALYHQGDPVFLRLIDRDQNRDPLYRETVYVSVAIGSLSESEYLLLIETHEDSGVFTGYIQSAANPPSSVNDGTLTVAEGCQIVAGYVDASDPMDMSGATALVDPSGLVFDSRTGQPVNGALLTLVNAETGEPAVLFGDDGRTSYPPAILSGGVTLDGGGKGYSFGPGEFRFPCTRPGSYRLEVVPPASYVVPSIVPTSKLQTLPGAPFVIDEAASRGEPFTVNPGPAWHADIPIDPVTTSLYLAKSVTRDRISIGDFLRYNLSVENSGAFDLAGISVMDRLPLGFAYEPGSTRFDEAAAADPTISSDGRTLTFTLDMLAAGATAGISYAVEVGAAAGHGPAVNRAVAVAADGTTSNPCEAAVHVTRGFFSDTGFIVGSVTMGRCGDVGEGGLGGVRIYLEDGTYVVTDEEGRYHFEGVRPGVHVVQLDLDGVPQEYEVVPCEESGRFTGRAYSQFVDLQGGTMWRADFHVARKPPLTGEVQLELTSIVEDNAVEYRARLHNSMVTLRSLRLTIMLPEGATYVGGSSSLDGAPLTDPAIVSNALVYRLGDASDGWTRELAFRANIDPREVTGSVATRGLLIFDTSTTVDQRTPLVENTTLLDTRERRIPQPEIVLHPTFATFNAELNETDREMLDQLVAEVSAYEITEISVVGHTDNVPIAVRSRHIYVDNYALSMARARSVARYLSDGLHLPPSQISLLGKGEDEPIASNSTAEGRALNRRVEVRLSSRRLEREGSIQGDKTRDAVAHETAGTQALEKPIVQDSGVEPPSSFPIFDEAWFEIAAPGLRWVWPEAGHNPPIPSLKVAVKHRPTQNLALVLDGEEVSALNFSETIENRVGTIAVSCWRGVDLHEGDNHFEVIARTADGRENGRLARTVHYSSPPVHVELVGEACRLVADGRNPPVVAVRLTDKDGHPAREGVIGTFVVDPPYRAQDDVDELRIHPLTDLRSRVPRFAVGRNGIAMAALEPTSITGEVTVRFVLTNGEHEVRAWLQPGERDWVLIGLAEGTLGYNTIHDHMEAIDETGVDEDFFQEGRAALFAKGRVRGKWLLTLAYDSERGDAGAGKELFGVIDPDQFYTLYGDGTQQDYDASSTRKLYLRIERDQFYALFGDYVTGLNRTELARYNRSFNGFKTELNTETVGFNAFASRTNQAFVKDEIPGDGTSGLYHMSRNNILINSEKIVVETRDRFHSETILSSENMIRHIDYNIDYASGVLLFKEPIPTRDGQLNPVFIVVDYEANDESDKSYNYGGRGSVRLLDAVLEVGTTYIHEGRVGGSGELIGVDAALDLWDNTRVETEFATTSSEFDGEDVTGDGYRAELTHRSGRLDGRVFVREQDGRFGLGQQNASERGTRKLGIDATERLGRRLSISAQAYRQIVIGADAARDVGEGRVNYSNERHGLHVGYRHARDELEDGTTNRSDQIMVGGNSRVLGDRLSIRVTHDQSLRDRNASVDFPTRTVVGAEYEIGEPVSVFVEQEFTAGEAADTRGTRAGLKATPWGGMQMRSSLEQRHAESGDRLFANLGLRQGWQVTDRWMLDAGLDHSWTAAHPGGKPLNPNVPLASGARVDFTSVSLGTTYREETWSSSSRVEARFTEMEEKFGLLTGIHGEPKEGLGLSAGVQSFRTDSQDKNRRTHGDARFGLAYRPRGSRWIILDRLDLIVDEQSRDSLRVEGWRIINNLSANCRANRKIQVAFQYGSKYVEERIEGRRYQGYTDLLGLETRYNITTRWDLGIRGSVLHSWDSEQFDYGTGLSIGYNLMENVWVSLGYNIIGFRAMDFHDGSFTAVGPVLQFRTKIDQASAGEAIEWLRGVIR